jgi:hypothetical protein
MVRSQTGAQHACLQVLDLLRWLTIFTCTWCIGVHADALSLAVLKRVCNIHLQALDAPAG